MADARTNSRVEDTMKRIGCSVLRFADKILPVGVCLAALAIVLPATAAAQNNGSSISPYTTLLEWNRANFSQFTKIDVPNSNGITESVQTSQPSTAYPVTPMAQWSGGSWPGGPYRHLISNDVYSPTADEDLVVEVDAGYGSGSTDKHGVGCFDPQNPTTDFYVLTKSNGVYWQLNKYVGGTLYVQAAPGTPTGYGGGQGTKNRIRFVLTNSGGVRVHMAGMTVMDVPMTLGHSRVLTSCKVGLVINVYQGAYMSALRVFRMKREGEQLF